jgi:hypothetical protein
MTDRQSSDWPSAVSVGLSAAWRGRRAPWDGKCFASSACAAGNDPAGCRCRSGPISFGVCSHASTSSANVRGLHAGATAIGRRSLWRTVSARVLRIQLTPAESATFDSAAKACGEELPLGHETGPTHHRSSRIPSARSTSSRNCGCPERRRSDSWQCSTCPGEP